MAAPPPVAPRTRRRAEPAKLQPKAKPSPAAKVSKGKAAAAPAEVAPESTSTIMQARVSADYAAELAADAEVLGLSDPTRSGIVRAGLRLLHRAAREERMSRDVQGFYRDRPVPPLLIEGLLQESDNLDAVLLTSEAATPGGSAAE